MGSQKASIRGALVRDMIQDIMYTSLGKPIQTGEFRKNPVEPDWVCPAGYDYEIIEKNDFSMEYLRPQGVVTGRVVLQLHGGVIPGLPMAGMCLPLITGWRRSIRIRLLWRMRSMLMSGW